MLDKNLKYKIFYENSTGVFLPITLVLTDRRTDSKKITVTFQNFARFQIRNEQTYIINIHRC